VNYRALDADLAAADAGVSRRMKGKLGIEDAT
jgi:hypothetical protein